ncbi:stage II sporulation protein M [Sphingobacterium paludis]|uniref:Stage II sporulation protein M n=1 Tax=Sphingobacterium paludis TaxID=1476465 RepID=A0A4R7D4L7_9SPHI|nr:stage II sporulation protein M [Sphingobacterium paludis]TDS16019.1 stage II sporulation protein M [Sphingobacterium paludis]
MKTLYNYQYGKVSICFVAWIVGGILASIISLSGSVNAKTNMVITDLGIQLKLHPILNILINNYLYLTSIYVFGFLSFGIYTIASFIFNGFLLGLYVKKATAIGFSVGKLIVLLGGHGPLEITAFVLAGSLTLIRVDSISYFLQADFSVSKLTVEFKKLKQIFVLPFILISIAALLEFLAYRHYL